MFLGMNFSIFKILDLLVWFEQGFSMYPALFWKLQYRQGCIQTQRDLPASAYQLLELKMCTAQRLSLSFKSLGQRC